MVCENLDKWGERDKAYNPIFSYILQPFYFRLRAAMGLFPAGSIDSRGPILVLSVLLKMLGV
jgi:hypothetical protein